MENFYNSEWSGSIELDIGDLGICMADADISYDTDGNTWRLGEYTVIAKINETKVDVSGLISEFAIEDIFNQYIVNGG